MKRTTKVSAILGLFLAGFLAIGTPASAQTATATGKTKSTVKSKKKTEEKIITTASGLQYVDYVIGTGVTPKQGQTVVVGCIGKLKDSTEFYRTTDPLEFPLGAGRVIKGWDEGISTMKVGGSRRLIIPSNLAYGTAGRAPLIKPNADLVFDVWLTGVK